MPFISIRNPISGISPEAHARVGYGRKYKKRSWDEYVWSPTLFNWLRRKWKRKWSGIEVRYVKIFDNESDMQRIQIGHWHEQYKPFWENINASYLREKVLVHEK